MGLTLYAGRAQPFLMAHDNEESEGTGGINQPSPSHEGLNKGEGRVLDRLVRARVVANLLMPDEEADLDDLIELAEMISDEGG